jgi:putative transposase
MEKSFLFNISKDRNMFVAARFKSDIVNEYGEYPISTDRGGTGHPSQACNFLKIDHHIHSSFDKSIIERTIQ